MIMVSSDNILYEITFYLKEIILYVNCLIYIFHNFNSEINKLLINIFENTHYINVSMFILTSKNWKSTLVIFYLIQFTFLKDVIYYFHLNLKMLKIYYTIFLFTTLMQAHHNSTNSIIVNNGLVKTIIILKVNHKINACYTFLKNKNNKIKNKIK